MDFIEEYSRIAENTLNKVFILKNKTYKQIDIENIDSIANLLTNEQIDLEKCKEKVSKRCKGHNVTAWRSHTMFCHPLKGLNTELMSEYSTLRPTISQAYIKFAELLECYPALTNIYRSFDQNLLRTLHLCEAPGCFVQALADFLPEKFRSKWVWRANSLMPYNETSDLDKMLIDDSFMAAYIDNFLPGPDDTGNLMHFTEDYIAAFLGETGKFQLVTCDGSFDCTDNPRNQENSVYPLIIQSWKIATKCLQNQGCAVIKIYTLFTEDTMSFLNQFCPMFEKVYLHKPAASKPSNSEIYLIGINFKEVAINEPVNNELRFAVYEASRFFSRHQTDMINFNLASFSKLNQYQRTAIEIKKSEIKSKVKNKLKFIPLTVLGKQFLRNLETKNHWQREAWHSIKMKYVNYEQYRMKTYRGPIDLPINFKPVWSLDLLNCFVLTPESLTSVVRNNFITLSSRSTHLNPMNPMLRINCSLFADYKLLEFAQELNISYYDLCINKKIQGFRRLRYHFIWNRSSGISIDNSFMSRTNWLELCYYAAIGAINDETTFPTSNISILLPRSEKELIIDSIRIYMTYGSTFILSRFAASVIFFISQFFEQVSIDENGIAFTKRIRVSDEMAKYIKKVGSNVPANYELLQFVPLKFFTNESIYYQISAFNNHALHERLLKETNNRHEHPLPVMG